MMMSGSAPCYHLPNSPEEVAVGYFQHSGQNAALYFHGGIPEDLRHSRMVSLRICYFAGGIVNLYKQWFRGDLDCTLNDIAMEVSKLLHLEAQELFGT